MSKELLSAAEKVVVAAQEIVRQHKEDISKTDISWRGVFTCACSLCSSIKEYNRLKKNS